MSLLEQAKSLLRNHRIVPKKSWGQNFTIDSSIFEHMVDYASLRQDDVVLDIGAGLGFLTKVLTNYCGEVFAVEADAKLVDVLRRNLGNVKNIRIFAEDILKCEIPSFNKVVSIPPYQIASPLLMWLFKRDFYCGVLVLQKEFVNRLLASIGDRAYGWLAVVAYYYVEIELLDDVPKWMFYPQPEVDSVIIRLRPKKPRPFTVKNEMFFRKLTQLLFTRRNRKVRNAILPFVKRKCRFSSRGAVDEVDFLPFHDRRVRDLAPEDFGVLANALGE